MLYFIVIISFTKTVDNYVYKMQHGTQPPPYPHPIKSKHQELYTEVVRTKRADKGTITEILWKIIV